MKANRILYILGSISIISVLISCNTDFMDIVPRDQLSSEAVFSTQDGADLFLNDIYATLPDFESQGRNDRTSNATFGWDQMDYFSPWYIPHFTFATSARRSQDRAITPDTYRGPTGLYNNIYPAIPFEYAEVTRRIRACNFFIESVESFKVNYTEEWYNRRVAEARVIRAYHYHYLWMAYGGVPLVTKVLNRIEQGDEIFQPSVSSRELFEFMQKECSEASEDLPNEVGQGRVTKGVALILKAWVELYMGDISKDPRPAEVGNADIAYSNLAYRACEETCQQIMNLGVYNLFPSYNGMFLQQNNNNSESIWAYQHIAGTRNSSRSRVFGPFTTRKNNNGGVGNPTQNLVDMYRMDNGLPITDPDSGFDPTNPYANREKRFYESIIYDGAVFGVDTFTIEGQGTKQPLIRQNIPHYSSGYYRRKGVDPTLTTVNFNNEESNGIYFRYAEVLLMYAEAKTQLNEIDATVIDAINQIRVRSELPTLLETYQTDNFSQSDLLEIIWNERVIELTWEAKSYWDIIRTRRAGSLLNQPNLGVRRNQNGDYTTYIIFPSVWPDDKYYLMPMYRDWLEKNPAWMDPENQVDGRVEGQNPRY